MTHPLLALREAIRARLLADAALSALLPSAKAHDAIPRGASPPFLCFEEAETRDAGADGQPATEQRLALAVHARESGLAQALAALDRVAALLDDAPLTLDGNRLIQLRVTGQELRRAREADRTRAVLRLRALTEPL